MMPALIPLALPQLQAVSQGFGDLPLPTDAEITAAVNRGAFMVGEYIRQLWTTIAQQRGVHDSGAYLRGIAVDGTIHVKEAETLEGRPLLDLEIEVTNTSEHAQVVEEGHSAFSMPQAIKWGSSPGVKRGKSGPYLIIPFRHTTYKTPAGRAQSGSTPSAQRQMMPESVSQRASSLQAGQRLQAGQIVGREQAPIAGRVVSMGRGSDRHAVQIVHRAQRVVGKDRAGHLLENPAWASSKYDGLTRVGAAGHGAYVTFRVITPTSKGWNMPAVPGHFIARDVAALVAASPEAGQLFLNGILATLGGLSE